MPSRTAGAAGGELAPGPGEPAATAASMAADVEARVNRGVVRGTAATLGGNVWTMVVTLVSLPLLLHALGASSFGIYALLLSFSAVSGWLALADLGIGAAATREVARARARDDGADAAAVVGTTLAVLGGLAAVSAIALLGAGTLALPILFSAPADLVGDVRLAIVLFAAQVGAELLIEGCEACIEGAHRVDISRWIDAARRTLVAGGTIATATVSHRLVVTVASGMGATLLALIGALICLRAVSPPGRPVRRHLKGLVGYGGRVSLLNAAGVLHRTMDRLIVGVALGPASVALVEIVTQLQNGALAVMSATAYAVPPAASTYNERGDITALRALVMRETRRSLTATLPIAFGLAIFSGPIVRVWVGSSYAEAVHLVPLGVAYVVMMTPLQVVTSAMQGAGRAGALVPASLVSVAVNLAASILLVHVLGVAGVFVGTLVGTSVLLVPYLVCSLRLVDVDPLTFVREGLAGGFLVGAVVAGVASLALTVPGLPDAGRLIVGAVLGGAALGAFVLGALRRRAGVGVRVLPMSPA